MDINSQDASRLVVQASTERFVPTCKICGNKHWPKDPSCLGKKGAKGRAKAKAKAAARAKARAKRLGLDQTDSQDIPQTVTTPQPVTLPGAVTQPFAKPHIQSNMNLQPAAEKVIKVKAKSQEEVSSFAREVEKIKQQADEVVSRASASAAEQFQVERDARLIAEEKAKQEAKARQIAEQNLKDEIEKLKALQLQVQKDIRSANDQTLTVGSEPADSDLAVKESVTRSSDRPEANVVESDTSVQSGSLRPVENNTAVSVGTLLAVRARDIMEENIVWAAPDDSISKVLDQMLLQDSYYAVVCQDGRIVGIMSRLDLTGRASGYLEPHLAKWQRDGADATFNVAVKWIMSKRIDCVAPEATCTAIMKRMRYLNMSPLPVVDRRGKVLGLVAPYNVFKIRALLKLEAQRTTDADHDKIERLPARITSYMSSLNASIMPDQSAVR